MIAYKLLRKKADGSITSLFINKSANLSINTWMEAKEYHTKGFALRKGWHCMSKAEAPHLSNKGRVWCEVEIKDFELFERPIRQGGLWFLAQQMKIIKEL